MKRTFLVSIAVLSFAASVASADTFGTGDNQFTIDFVSISGDTNPTSGIPAGYNFTFTGVANDYRMGTYEITNDQWFKFGNSLGARVTGSPSYSYDQIRYWTGSSVPTNNVSWHEAAQFVNFLNTSKGYQAAYKFVGTQGTSGYTFGVWSASDAGYNAANPYRNSNAFYFLPTEDEWVKAAYWNGTSLQAYATKAGESLYRGNGSNGGWNYYGSGPNNPWAVGSGSQELNGTYDMMGNVWEWMESPYSPGQNKSFSDRSIRGGSYEFNGSSLASSYPYYHNPPGFEYEGVGFRVASIVPEPCSLALLFLGGLVLRGKR
jgi:formylglycine-generating enzyme required for sulfatase activity